MTIRSMTGFARARRSGPDGEIALSVKSLNHRGLDIHFHLPDEFDPFEGALRSVVKRMVTRGHLEVRSQMTRIRGESLGAVNRPLLDAYVSAFRQASSEHGLNTPPDLNAAFQIPGMFSQAAAPEPRPELEAALVSLLEEALTGLNAFREREGAQIAAVLHERIAAIHQAVERIAGIRNTALASFQARLEERLSELLRSASIDPQRLVQEAAILSDRTDIGEEVARLRIHTAQLDGILDAGGEVGKKLDFLLQEMNRETNTILSKTTGIGETGLTITDMGLAIKSDIEKIREQSLNLE